MSLGARVSENAPIVSFLSHVLCKGFVSSSGIIMRHTVTHSITAPERKAKTRNLESLVLIITTMSNPIGLVDAFNHRMQRVSEVSNMTHSTLFKYYELSMLYIFTVFFVRRTRLQGGRVVSG